MTHEHRSSSESANVVEKVNSVAELLPALQRGAKAAVWEGPESKITLNRHELKGKVFLLERALFELRDQIYLNGADAAEKKIASIRAQMDFDLDSIKEFDADIKRVLRALFDEIAVDLCELGRHVPGYTLDRLGVFGDYNSLIEVWHLDNEKGNPPGLLRYIRTIQGPSTEFAKNKQGESRIVVGKAARVLLTTGPNGAWHRSPRVWPKHRVAYNLWLKPVSR